jgi:hypothetical protein
MPTDFFFFFLFSCFTLYSLYCREARIVFKPGKNRDRYFDLKQLMAQVDRAIDIFEGKANGLQGLFMFDNAPSHLRRADDAISVTKMVKSECCSFFFCLIDVLPDPKRLWTHYPKGPCMRDGINPLTGECLLHLLSYLVFTRFAYASYLPYLYDRTVSTVYRTHFGLCHYLDT